ncbi:MAG: urea transporter [Alphaproteobacteria bacterium]|nr:urea transporter [Alphaproteobacteria bacterium]
MTSLAPLRALVITVGDAYGALLALPRPAAVALVAATLTHPVAGIAGFGTALTALVLRRWAGLSGLPGNLDLTNAAMVGVLTASLYAPSLALAVILACAAGAVVAVAELARTGLKVPVLGLPALVVSWGSLAIAWTCGLAPAAAPPLPWSIGAPEALEVLVASAGATVGTPNLVAGLVVLGAILATSPRLFALALGGWVVAEALLAVLTGTLASPIRVAVGANAMLAAMIVGGLYSLPSLRRVWLPALVSAATVPVALAAASLLAPLLLPPLGLPCLAACWSAVCLLRPERSSRFQRLWQASPALPERAAAASALATARGFAPGSVALALPYQGAMTVYQAIDGAHTHQGPWRYAVDFHDLVDGVAYRGAGRVLSDYHCYGRLVTAPVSGWVVGARHDLPDLAPGQADTLHVWGNHVMIATADGVHVLVAHLQTGSILVPIGAWVAVGQPIARIGNSGRSPQPHLHLHVQACPTLGAATVPFHLTGALRDGEWRLDHQPALGECLAAPVPSPSLAQALALPVGRTLDLRDGRGASHSLTSQLDLTGGASLTMDAGASVGLYQSAVALALFNRQGTSPVLDMVTLALGLVPTVEEVVTWRDAPAAALLPGWAGVVGRLTGAALTTTYHRRWDAAARRWRQTGVHRLILLGRTLASAQTVAVYDDADGLIGVSLACGTTRQTAHVTAIAGRADQGIPGWRADLCRSSA